MVLLWNKKQKAKKSKYHGCIILRVPGLPKPFASLREAGVRLKFEVFPNFRIAVLW